MWSLIALVIATNQFKYIINHMYNWPVSSIGRAECWTVNQRPRFNSQMVVDTFIVIGNEILSTVIYTVPILLHVQKLSFSLQMWSTCTASPEDQCGGWTIYVLMNSKWPTAKNLGGMGFMIDKTCVEIKVWSKLNKTS
jgi:hypothetical protein